MILGFLPVILFLVTLVFYDSYKLVRFRFILFIIFLGCVAAGVSYWLNTGVLHFFEIDKVSLSRYGAPVIEELLKAVFLLYLIKAKRVGFMVDAAIFGFALGAGFALTENMFVYFVREDPLSLSTWVIRGAGTAVMHGGTTAIFGIISKNVSDRKSSDKLPIFVPGLLIAIVIHSFYNHFFVKPEVLTLMILITFPLLIIAVFAASEKSLKKWLGTGFDADMELVKLINSGDFTQSNIGRYIQSLKGAFPGRVVADMLCYLRIHVELAIRAKGILLIRNAGFSVTRDPEVSAKFDELKYLEKSIGKTGKLALLPFLHKSTRDLWQLYMIDK